MGLVLYWSSNPSHVKLIELNQENHMKTYMQLYKQAVKDAIIQNHKRGLPVYQCKKGYIVAIYPDGKEIILQKSSTLNIQ